MEKVYDLGTHKLTAQEIGNGYLSPNCIGDMFYYPTFANLFYKFVTEQLPALTLHDPMTAYAEEMDWTDVKHKLFDAINEEGDGFFPSRIDYEVEIKIKAIVNE